jgi:hypothetical protein
VINQNKFIARKPVSVDAVSNLKLSGILSVIAKSQCWSLALSNGFVRPVFSKDVAKGDGLSTSTIQ